MIKSSNGKMTIKDSEGSRLFATKHVQPVTEDSIEIKSSRMLLR